jgi:hypothetical protein
MLKHKKVFVCDIEGCKRSGKGFSTTNDLDRHKKSVHGIDFAKTKSYRCAADDCQNKTKVWPRLDNFKQHIERMHKDHEVIDLIKRLVAIALTSCPFTDACSSECQPQGPQEAQIVESQAAVVDPSHLLAGMVSDGALLTGGANLGALPGVTQDFSYPQFMSISGRSNSATSLVSPGSQSLNMSFLQSEIPSTSGCAPQNPTFSQASEGIAENQSSRQKSNRVSLTGRVIKPTSDGRHNRPPALQVPVSNAPQTKSEQQRRRLDIEKLPKNKLQELVLQALESQQEGDRDSSKDSRDISQELARLVQGSVSNRPQQRRSTQGSTSSSGMQQCPYDECTFFGRTCDLNKHVKRHQKPYGCTYPKCYKKFGAKSDWKRHENSQHFQQETFRCGLSKPDGTCGQHFYRSAQFRNHLELEHRVTVDVQDVVDRYKIGKNCQGQYWCGFCCKIKKLQTRRNYAWDERFDHIAQHFEKDTPKKNIDDWICVEENATKRALQQKMLLDKEDRTAEPDDCADDELPTAFDDCSTSVIGQSSLQSGANKRSAPPSFHHDRRPSKQMRLVSEEPAAITELLVRHCVSGPLILYYAT